MQASQHYRTKTLTAIVSLLVLAMAAGVGPVSAQAGAEDLDTLMKSSGLLGQLTQVGPGIQVLVKQSQKRAAALPIEPQAWDGLLSAIESAYGADKLEAGLREHLQSALTETEVDEALAWLSSPLGKKIAKLREKAGTTEAILEMRADRQQLESDLTAERRERLVALDEALQSTDTIVTVSVKSSVIMYQGLASIAPPGSPIPPAEQIIRQMEGNRDRLKSSMQQTVLLSLIYSYKDLSDADLDSFIEFAKSEAGSKFYGAVHEGLAAAMAKSEAALPF